MFCIVAFVVLSILGIFSATNRELAKEAFDCVSRRVTLRPCTTGFDEKMKSRILGTVIMRSEPAAMFLNRNFELLSWTFFVLMLASSIWSVRGLYLFYTTGNCNGANEAGFCVFDPTGSNNKVSNSANCPVHTADVTGLTLANVNVTGMPELNPQGKDQILMIGCYHCDYTRKAYPEVIQLVQKYGAHFTFINYPTKEKTDYFSRLGYCAYQQDPEKYWKLNDILFTTDKTKLDPEPALVGSPVDLGLEATSGAQEANEVFVRDTLTGLGYQADSVLNCVADSQTKAVVKQQLDQVVKTNFYGTPTLFIDGKPLVGPKPYRVYAIMLKGLFYWAY